MPLKGELDLHANRSVVVFRNEQGQVIARQINFEKVVSSTGPTPSLRIQAASRLPLSVRTGPETITTAGES